MQASQLINSRTNNKNKTPIVEDITLCIHSYIQKIKQKNVVPFKKIKDNIAQNKSSQLSKFKKSLIDWRSVLSQNKVKRQQTPQSNIKMRRKIVQRQNQQDFVLFQQEENIIHKQNNNQRLDSAHHNSNNRRNLSSLSGRNHRHIPINLIDRQLTSFSLVQNIYESQFQNFESKNNQKTARIRSFYLKKFENLKDLKLYKQIETGSFIQSYRKRDTNLLQQNQTNKISSDDVNLITKRGRNQKQTKQRTKSSIQRFLIPGEYYRNCNTAKINKRSIMRQYQVN